MRESERPCDIRPMSEQHLLVLDLDETLIFASREPLVRDPDHVVGPYSVYHRPGLASFLDFAFERFNVAVWTSSSPAYARGVCEAIFPDQSLLAFVWASDRCTMRRDIDADQWVQVKNFAKLRRRGFNLDRVLVVDDSPEKHIKNYGNLVLVRPYYGETEDDELHALSSYLAKLSSLPDVRSLEKRNWRRL